MCVCDACIHLCVCVCNLCPAKAGGAPLCSLSGSESARRACYRGVTALQSASQSLVPPLRNFCLRVPSDFRFHITGYRYRCEHSRCMYLAHV